jgi:signal transduction histidine kinase
MIRIKDDGQNWIIDITDNGPGFGIRDPKRLFEAFYTTKSEQQGMGLGLAISAAIVEEHHGKIWAAQNPQGGAIFYVSLPKPMPAKGKVS